jgi:hypothetical protein
MSDFSRPIERLVYLIVAIILLSGVFVGLLFADPFGPVQ